MWTEARSTRLAFLGGVLAVLSVGITGPSRPPLFAAPRVDPRAKPPEEVTKDVLVARLPLAFEENRGQFRTPALFAARAASVRVFAEAEGVTLQVLEPPRRGEEGTREPVGCTNLRLAFEGASPHARLEGRGELPGVVNMFLGNDPANWRAGIPTFSGVEVRGLYPGVDLFLRGTREGALEYDLQLAPGADLDRIVIRVEGAAGALRLEEGGALGIPTAAGLVRQTIPASWQVVPGGGARAVRCRQRLIDEARVAFDIEGRDASLGLVIDPGLVYSSYLGGSQWDIPRAVATDASGNSSVVGETLSADFPLTPGSLMGTPQGSYDAFLSRFSPTGVLLYSTYLGGLGTDSATGIALDATGSATVAGTTQSPDFPVTPGAFDSTLAGEDAFVARLNAAGLLDYSTYLGGSGLDGATSLALAPTGSPKVAGTTNSPDFPAGASLGPAVGLDGFVSTLSPTGGSLLDSVRIGGSDGDWIRALALESGGEVILAGETRSPDLPVTAGAFDTTFNTSAFFAVNDGFVARLAAGGSGLLYATYLGGGGPPGTLPHTWVWGARVDASGVATVCGTTYSASFPTTAGAFHLVHAGETDGFVTRLAPSGAALLYSTFLGGNSFDGALAVAVDSTGAMTVAGNTRSPNFGATPGAFDTLYASNPGFYQYDDAFVSRLAPDGGILPLQDLYYSTFLGGSDEDAAYAIALDAYGVATVAGNSTSPDFPVTPGAPDPAYTGVSLEGFVARLDLLPAGASPYGTSTPGCAGPLSIGVTRAPKVGSPFFAFTCSNAPPNSPAGPGGGIVVIGGSPLGTPVPFFGASIWIDAFASPFFLLLAGSNPLGASKVVVPIPNTPAIVGAAVYTQFFWPCLNFCVAGGICASNALAVTVQP